MKYLKQREEFIKNNIIEEALSNEIAWGDSLLGRLINSTLRKLKVGGNLLVMDNVIKKLNASFDELLEKAKITGAVADNKKLSSNINKCMIASLLSELKRGVESSVEKKTAIGVTKGVLGEVMILEDQEGKKELLDKLNEFLKAIDTEPESKPEVKPEEVKPEEKKDGEKKEPLQLKSGETGDKELNAGNSSKEVALSKTSTNSKNQEKISKIKSKIEAEKKVRDEEKKKGVDTSERDKMISNFEDQLSGLEAKGEGNEHVICDYSLFIKMNEDWTSGDQKETKDPSQKAETKDPSQKAEVEETESPKEEDFKSVFNKIFTPEYLKKWLDIGNLAKTTESEVEKLTKDSTKIVIDGMDPIIEIVRLFNRAYKIHTTQVIPTGRSGGKVSNKTFREYTSFGGGSPATAGESGGPYRNNVLFNKWEDAVTTIIKNSKYQVLFNEDTEIKIGKADPRVNISRNTGSKVEGGGKVLLKFMNSMMDGDDLYKKGAQAAFIEKYFDVTVDSKKLGLPGDSEKNAQNAGKIPSKKKCRFSNLKEINTKNERTFYAIETTGGDKYYMTLLESNEKFTYVKYSYTFYQFGKYSAKVADIDKGQMPQINLRDRRNDKDQKIYAMHYAKIPVTKPIKIGSSMEIKSLNIFEYNKDSDTKSEAKKIDEITSIYGVVDVDGNLFVLPDDQNTWAGASGGTNPDGNAYDKYKAKLV